MLFFNKYKNISDDMLLFKAGFLETRQNYRKICGKKQDRKESRALKAVNNELKKRGILL